MEIADQSHSTIVPGNAPDGTPILSLVVKATFDIVPGQELVPTRGGPLPLYEIDGDAESDLVAYKPLTDVLLLGPCHAPRGKMAMHMDVGIAIADRVVGVRVFGDRKVDISRGTLRFSDPTPFASMPTGYDRAYGGVDLLSDPARPFQFPSNPGGVGYRVLPNQDSLHGLALPNLENLADLLTPERFVAGSPDKWISQPSPAYFGCVPRASFPRASLAGLPPEHALDASLARKKQVSQGQDLTHAPDVRRMDPAFHNCAPQALRFPYLAGNEKIQLKHFDPDFPLLEFDLPGLSPEGWLDVGEGPSNFEMVLHTVEIRPSERKVALVWRGSCSWNPSNPEYARFEHGVDF